MNWEEAASEPPSLDSRFARGRDWPMFCRQVKHESPAAMNRWQRPLLIVLTAALVLPLAACSKTAQWEEEVLVNTGETIWVRRTVQYTFRGDAGNPLDMAYRRDGRTEVTEFSWRGKHYSFNRHAGIVVLAISPQGVPVLVAEADAGLWGASNNYKCTVPFYVQFVPDATGRHWTWPPKIEPWLYNLENNLLFDKPTPEDGKRRYTVEQRKTANARVLSQSPSRQRIDPAHTGDLCKPKVQ